jgi:hypothetical protein
MANYNLTSQQLKDTYEQLAQVNDSNVLVDGLGVASPIVTASIINFPTEVSRSAAAAGFGQGGGTATWPVSGTPSNILSSSAQIATDISGAFTSTSASLAAGIATKLNTSTFTSYSSSVSTRLTTDESNISTNTSNIATQTSRVDSLVAATSSYARTNVNNSFSGTQNFVNIAVSGTASIAHVQTVTGSAVIIGEEFIILNASTPAARYAGIKIYDTGSTNATASLEWDGIQDTWILMEESGDTAVILTGMTGSRGSEAFPTTNRVQKGGGFNQLTDSNITDNGTSVSVSTPLSASSLRITSENAALTFPNEILIGSQHFAGDANDGIYIGTRNRNTSTSGRGIRSIMIGTSGSIQDGGTGGENILIGNRNSADNSGNNINIGNDTQTYINSIAIGKSAICNSADAIAIGNDAVVNVNGAGTIVIGHNANNIDDNRANSVIIGNGASSYQNGVAIGAGAFSIESAVAVGLSAQNGNNYGVAVGASANSGDTYGIAIGYQSTAGNDSIAIGYGVSATTANEINIGNTFKFDGTSTITLEGSLIKVADSASATGSLIDNIHPAIASSSAQIKHIVTLTQDQYFAISGSGNANDDTFYIISDAGDNVYPGNLQVSGQIYTPTFAGSVASSTSSVDFNNGNFATLNLTVPTFLANPSNLQSGTTYTIIIDSGSLVTNYGSAFKFAGGTQPTLSNGIDILTMVSDGTSLYATALADFQ